MTRRTSIFGQKSGPAKTFFGQKSGHGQPTVPPAMAMFGEALYIFLNHCGYTGWSAPLMFANPP